MQIISRVISSAAILVSLAYGQNQISTNLTMDVKALDFAGSRKTGTMYMPDGVQLSNQKPAGITKEPTYQGAVTYGVFKVGNGPHSLHALAIDVPKDGSNAKLYVDVAGDGNLMSGGDGTWDKKVTDGLAQYSKTVVLNVSYGNPNKQSHTAPYALNFYWGAGRTSIFYYRASQRVGSVKLGGQSYTVRLIENNNDGVFNESYTENGKPTKPVWIVLDGTMADIRGTFPVDGYNYLAQVSDDGSRLTLKPTIRSVSAPKQVASATEKPLLPVGSSAPDFEVPAWDGGNVRLSNLRGKVVVLDFWATWCGPCKASLPHVQKVYDQVKDKNVVVLALNVWDDKTAYNEWIPANKQYSLPFAYDPAGRGAASIATHQYMVSGIPTTYVIGPDGKIAASIVGFDGLSDHRLEEALAKLNVPIEAPKSIPAIGLSGR